MKTNTLKSFQIAVDSSTFAQDLVNGLKHLFPEAVNWLSVVDGKVIRDIQLTEEGSAVTLTSTGSAHWNRGVVQRISARFQPRVVQPTGLVYEIYA